jgi:hypothetical protein
MRRWLIPLVLAMASRVASAEPEPAVGPTAAPAVSDAEQAAWAALSARTDAAIAASAAADRDVGQLAGQRKALAQRYEAQLASVDGLKKQRASWRRDRELRSSLAESLDTARQLDALTLSLTAAQQRLVVAGRGLRAAIDAELGGRGGHIDGARATRLLAARAGVGGATAGSPRRIVIPDAQIDPLADPEELEQQAAALRESEVALAREVSGLDGQATELRQLAELRRQHDRAGDLAMRDDDQPHRTAPASTGRSAADTLQSPTNGGAAGTGPAPGNPVPGLTPPPDKTGSSFEAEATVVLADVVDATTIAALAKAQRSGDPGVRAQAAQATRDAVAARLKALRERRAAIEARAKALRGR